jgi:hypothetical protein
LSGVLVVSGAVVGLFSTLLAAILLTRDAPVWLATLAFAHLPWNLVLLVGVGRSAGSPAAPPPSRGWPMLAWVVVLSPL